MYVPAPAPQGAEAFHCERCGDRTPATKHLRVHRFPEVLVLQIKRFKYKVRYCSSTTAVQQQYSSSTSAAQQQYSSRESVAAMGAWSGQHRLLPRHSRPFTAACANTVGDRTPTALPPPSLLPCRAPAPTS